MFKRLLVPHDGSKRADQALSIVKALNRAGGIELILLEIATQNTLPVLGSSGGEHPLASVFLPEDGGQAPRRVHHLADVTRSTIPHTIAMAASGDPVEKIVEIANENEVDLILMVSHGYGGLKRLLRGSVTEDVIRRASCPVLALKDNHLPTHFLIALDGSPASETILAPALILADMLAAEVTIAHIQPESNKLSARDLGNLAAIDPSQAAEVTYANLAGFEGYLTGRLAELMATLNLPVDYRTAFGSPGDGILAIAEHGGCDLIAMATHGRRGVMRLLKGSVTETVFRHTDRAMLVVHTMD